MKNSRPKVDIFLIELDKFIKRYQDVMSEDQLIDLIIPFKIGKPSSYWPKESIPLSTLEPLINKAQKSKYDKNPRVRRTSNYIRRVAYKLDFISVKWDSYYEIFSKLLLEKWNDEFKIVGLNLKDFYRENPCKEFIIPKDYWQINYDMYFNGHYEINNCKGCWEILCRCGETQYDPDESPREWGDN